MHIGEKKMARLAFTTLKSIGTKTIRTSNSFKCWNVVKAKAAARQTAAKVICPKFAEPKNGGTVSMTWLSKKVLK